MLFIFAESWASLLKAPTVPAPARAAASVPVPMELKTPAPSAPAAPSRPGPTLVPSEQRPKGILNLGNTCFMSAVLQSLLHCPDFLALYPAGAGAATPLWAAVSALIAQSAAQPCSASAAVLDPSAVYTVTRAHCPAVRGAPARSQHDAEEFLGFLVGRLSDEHAAGVCLGALLI